MHVLIQFLEVDLVYKKIKNKNNMKNLKEYINEGNISNVERKYREFCQMCKGYNVNLEDIEVEKTSKNNWAVYIDGKKRFVVSSNILDNNVVEKYNIQIKK